MMAWMKMRYLCPRGLDRCRVPCVLLVYFIEATIDLSYLGNLGRSGS